MKSQMGILSSLIIVTAGISAGSLNAQVFSDGYKGTTGEEHFTIDDQFHPGRKEANFGVGTLFSPMVVTQGRPTVDYTFGYAQLGFMVTEIAGSGILRGNLELAPEFFAAGIYENTGHYIVGGTLYIRYNFIQPGWRLIPYFQCGGGSVYTDMSHIYDGMNYNFNVGGSAGLRYLFTRHCSMNIEYRFQHISNANLWSRNVGENTGGPVVGLSYFF